MARRPKITIVGHHRGLATEIRRRTADVDVRRIAGSSRIARQTETFISDGTPRQRLVLSALPSLDYEVDVRVRDMRFTRIDKVSGESSWTESTPDDKHFVLYFDKNGNAVIRFGNGERGLIPPEGPITVEYVVNRAATAMWQRARGGVHRLHDLSEHPEIARELTACVVDPITRADLRYALSDLQVGGDIGGLTDHEVVDALSSRLVIGSEPMWARRLGGGTSPIERSGARLDGVPDFVEQRVKQLRDLLFSCMHPYEQHERQLENAPFIEVVPEVSDRKDVVRVLYRDDFTPEPSELVAVPRSPHGLKHVGPEGGVEGQGHHRYDVNVEYVESISILDPLIALVTDPMKTVGAYFVLPLPRTARQRKEAREAAEKKWKALHAELDQAHKDGLLYGAAVSEGQNVKRLARVGLHTFAKAATFRKAFWGSWWEQFWKAHTQTTDYVIVGAMRRIPVKVYSPHKYKIAVKLPSLSWSWGAQLDEGGAAGDKTAHDREQLAQNRTGGAVDAAYSETATTAGWWCQETKTSACQVLKSGTSFQRDDVEIKKKDILPISLERDEKELFKLDPLGFVAPIADGAKAVSGVLNEMRDVAPRFFSIEYGVALFAGSFAFEWGFKEHSDHRVYRWRKASFDMTLIEVNGTLSVGVRWWKLELTLIRLTLAGKVGLGLEVERRNPDADKKLIIPAKGEIKGELGARFKAGSLVQLDPKITGGLEVAAKAEIGDGFHIDLELTRQAVKGGVYVTVEIDVVKTMKVADDKAVKEWTFWDKKRLWKRRWPDPGAYTPPRFTVREIENLMRDKVFPWKVWKQSITDDGEPAWARAEDDGLTLLAAAVDSADGVVREEAAMAALVEKIKKALDDDAYLEKAAAWKRWIFPFKNVTQWHTPDSIQRFIDKDLPGLLERDPLHDFLEAAGAPSPDDAGDPGAAPRATPLGETQIIDEPPQFGEPSESTAPKLSGEKGTGVLQRFPKEVEDLARRSPSLAARLDALDGWRIIEAGISECDTGNKLIRIERGQSVERTVQILAHETAHATYERRVHPPAAFDTRDKYVAVNVREGLLDEGNAQFEAAKARAEIIADGGPDIGIPGSGGYHEIYLDHVLDDDLPRAEAVEGMAKLMANETPNTSQQESYSEFLSKPYEKFWDQQQRPTDPPPYAGGGNGP